MTSPTTQQTGHEHTIVENIDWYMHEGLPVFDAYGERIGEVKMYSTVAGYLMVSTGAFDQKNLYIPYRMIRSIDPNDVFLTAPKSTLEMQYTQPPQISTVSETRVVVGAYGAMVPQTIQVQMVQSGYDSQPVTMASADLGATAQQLAIGMAVYDATGERVGEITQYDTPRGLMVVQDGMVKPRVLFVPFSAIQRIDRDGLTVYLALPKDVIVKEHSMLQAGA